MNNILDGKKGKLTILLADPHTEAATNTVKELVKDLTNNHTPTLLYEFISKSYYEILKLDEDKLKSSNLYLGKTQYIEDIYYFTLQHKISDKIKYLIIDGLDEILTRERYCLGRTDIISVIIKKLKELAEELGIVIIATAPTSQKTNIDELSTNKSKVLSYFCKAEIAQEYIDNIYLLEKENNYNE